MTSNPAAFLALVCAAMLLAHGCAGLVRKDAVPPELTNRAVVPGLADVRYRVGIDTDALRKDAIDSFWKEVAHLRASGHRGKLPPAIYLAVSGGGDDGAFGAGLLNGWTAAGDRPEFRLVANGRSYQEMHVDGGTMAQVFVYPPLLHVA